MFESPDLEDVPSPPPLTGIRVLDVSTLFAGPLAATFLSDFGTDVKVEHPSRPDARVATARRRTASTSGGRRSAATSAPSRSDAQFWQSFGIGMIWAVTVTLLQVLGGLCLTRVLAIIPWAMPPVVVAIM